MKLIRKSSLFCSLLMVYKYSTTVRKKEKKIPLNHVIETFKWFPPLRKKTPRSIRTRITVRQRSRGLWQRYTVGEGEVHPHPLRVTQQVADPSPPHTPPNCGSCRTPCINNRCRHVALTPWGTSPPCATLDPTFNPPQTFHLHSWRKVVILELLVKSSLFIKLNRPKIVPCFKRIYRSYFWLQRLWYWKYITVVTVK